MTLQPFHLAVCVDDLNTARHFYGKVLGCAEGRSARDWVDFDFFGHQLVCHLIAAGSRTLSSAVDSQSVPVPHFGLVLERQAWRALADRLEKAGVNFALKPGIRFAGKVGEQATFFIYDPAGNALEFKSMSNPDALFAR